MQEVAAALEKAADWLASKQKSDGSWPADRQMFNVPEDWLSEQFVTGHAAHTLLLAGNVMHVGNVQRAIAFCVNRPLVKMDPISWYASNLLVLNFSDGVHNRRQSDRLAKVLIRRQDADGSWPVYPNALNSMNFMVVTALADHNAAGALNGAVRWFRSCVAADDYGWGETTPKDVQVTATAKVSLSLLLCNERPDSRLLRNARRFLESKQNADGNWDSPRFKVPSTDATACSTLALMLLSKTPFNERVEKAVRWLLKTQSRVGGWPYYAGTPPRPFNTHSVVRTLAFWKHLHEQWERPEIRGLRESMGPQATAVWLWRRFPAYLKERYEHLLVRSMLDSKALGSTKAAIMRRKEILRTLSKEGPGDTAEVIDRLKPLPEYAHLRKKSHITQIKNDLDYLKDVNLVSMVRGRYAVVKDFLQDQK